MTAVVLNDGMGEKKRKKTRHSMYSSRTESAIRVFTVSTSEKHNKKKKKTPSTKATVLVFKDENAY